MKRPSPLTLLCILGVAAATACSSAPPDTTNEEPAEQTAEKVTAAAPAEPNASAEAAKGATITPMASGFGYSITPGYCTYCWKLEDMAASFCQGFGWQLGQNECFHGGCDHYNHIAFSCR